MTVDVGRALSETVQEMATRRGLALVGGFVLVSALSLTLSWALAIALAESFLSALLGVGQEAGPALSGAEREMLAQQVGAVQEAAPIALDLPAGVALAALLAVALGAEAITLLAIRVFGEYETEEGEPLYAGLGLATLNGFLGGIVLFTLVSIGLVLLVIPGVFLYVVFLFYQQEIALQDRNFIEALAQSWRVTAGIRLRVFGLAILVVLVSLVGGVPSAIASATQIQSIQVASAVLVGPVVTVFTAGLITRAYVGVDETAETEEPSGALRPEDIPEP